MRSLLLLLLTTVVLFSAEIRVPAPAAAAASPASKPQWQLSVVPASDGTNVVTAKLPADAPIPSGFAKVTPTLVVRYRAGQVSAFIAFDTFLGEGVLDAAVTFGDQPPEKQPWRIASDGRSAFVPGDALAFVQRLKDVSSFTVRITPRKDRTLDVTFTPHDTELVIKALLSAGVKYGG